MIFTCNLKLLKLSSLIVWTIVMPHCLHKCRPELISVNPYVIAALMWLIWNGTTQFNEQSGFFKLGWQFRIYLLQTNRLIGVLGRNTFPSLAQAENFGVHWSKEHFKVRKTCGSFALIRNAWLSEVMQLSCISPVKLLKLLDQLGAERTGRPRLKIPVPAPWPGAYDSVPGHH